MSLLYEDTGKQLTAESAIRSLKQGKRPVENDIAEFKRWAREAEWNDISLRNQFRLGLSDSLKDELSRSELPPTLEAIMLSSISIDRRLRERTNERTSGVPHTPRRVTSTPTEEPMEVGTVRDPISQTEKDRRRTQNLCLYCASPDHILVDCPLVRRKSEVGSKKSLR